MGECLSLHAWSLNDMRGTTVLLLFVVACSTSQALRVRGSRKKYVLHQPVETLNPAEKEYFSRLMWLMKHPTNGSALNFRYNDTHSKAKLTNGSFYRQVHGHKKESGGSYKIHETKHTIRQHHYGSQNNKTRHSSSSTSKNEGNSLNNENQGQSKNKLVEITQIRGSEQKNNDYVNIGLHDYDFYERNRGKYSHSEGNERPGPYIVKRVETSSYSKENDEKNRDSTGPSKSIEYQGPNIVKSEEANINSTENEEQHHVNDSSSSSNKLPGANMVKDEETIYSRENEDKNRSSDDLSKINDRPGPNAVNSVETNSYSSENDEKHQVNNGALKSNELPGPNIVKSEEINSDYIENAKQNHGHDGPTKSNDLPDPYVIKSEETNSNSIENDKNRHESGGPLTSVEPPGPIIIKSVEVDSSSKENDIKNHGNDNASKSKELSRPYIVNIYEGNNSPEVASSDENINVIKSNEILDPYIVQSVERDRPSNENDIEYPHNKDINKIDSTFKLEAGQNDENKQYFQEIIDEILNNNKDHQYHMDDIEWVKPIGIDTHKHEPKHRDRYEKRQPHHQKHRESSKLPQFIMKPNLTIISAPRLTSLVIKMCDNSEPNVSNVWKRVAKYLGLDSDYTIKNINQVHWLFKIIKAFVDLSKNENFRELPLEGILWAINEKISKENDENGIEHYIKNKVINDVYSSKEDSYDKGLRERPNSLEFSDETALEPVEIPSDSLIHFIEYIFENQEDALNSPDQNDISNSVGSNEFDIGQTQESEKGHQSTESPDFLSPDESSNEKSVEDSREDPVVHIDPDNTNKDQREDLPVANSSEYPEPNSSTEFPYSPNPDDNSIDVLPDSPVPDISSSNEPEEELPAANTEENSDINSSDVAPISINPDIVLPSPGNSYEEPTSDILYADDQNADVQSYSPIPYFVSKEPVSDETNPESNSHGNEPGVNNSVDVSAEIPSASSYQVTEETNSPEQNDLSITENPNSKDMIDTLITELLGKDLSESLLPIFKNYSQCKSPVHDELLQKLRDIVEILENAECL